MSVGVNSLILLVSLQIRHMHSDHCSLFLLDIQKFNEAVFQGVVEVHRFIGLKLHHGDVPILNPQLSVLNNEQRPLDSACIGIEPDFFVLYVPHNGDFFRDFKLTAKLLDAAN